MPSQFALRGTGLNAADFGGFPSPDECTVSCSECDATTTADDTDGWSHNYDSETYEQTDLCPSCSEDGDADDT